MKGGAGSQFLCPQSLLSFPSRASLTLPVVQETAYAFLKRIFLPVGYPHSTADGYMKFSQNTFFQILFSQMSRVMATQAMLLAVGVGTKQTVPLAAVTAWVLKDGIGHIVAIAFGTFINQRFDSDPKRFRFQAATLGKLADSVSILTLHWPQYFLPLSALGGAFSRLSANTGASCRPKIYETFALSSNLGDIMRCMTAQTTAAQLLGTAMGAAVGPFLGSNLYALMSSSILLSAATVFACYRATSVVRLSTVNRQRAELVFQPAVAQICAFNAKGIAPLGQLLDVPTIQEVQEKEVFVKPYNSEIASKMEVNPPMTSSHLLLTPTHDLSKSMFLLAVCTRESALVQKGSNAPTIALWYHVKATSSDVLQGFLQASLLREMLQLQLPDDGAETALVHLCERAKELSTQWWPTVNDAIQRQGWQTDVVFLDAKDERVEIE